MPQPTTNATLRPDLAGALEEFDRAANRGNFIGLRVMPIFETAKKSGTFGRIPVEQLLRRRKTKRAPKSGYGRGDWKFVDETFNCEEHGWEEPVDDTEAELYKDYFQAELIAAETVLDVLLMNHEARVAAMVQDTAQVANAAKGGGVYSNAATATPIADVEAAWKEIRAACGLEPNAVIIPRPTFRLIRHCDEFLDRVKYNGLTDVKPANVTPQIMAQMFDIEEVIVPGGVENIADEGADDPEFAELWDQNKMTLCKVARKVDIKEPCIGRTFHWSGDGSSPAITVEEYREEDKRSKIIRGRHHVGEKLLHVESAFIVTGVNPAS